MKFSKLLKAFTYFWFSKRIWNKPKNAEVLIFDRCECEVFFKYLDSNCYEILDVRGESLNIPVLLKCLLHLKFSMIDYILQYLEYVRPSFALTFIHNNYLFYQLKSSLKGLTSVFVQNGLNSYEEFEDFKRIQAGLTNRYEVDHMLTFGIAMGGKFAEIIKGNVQPIGSFKNNTYQSVNKEKPGSVLFLSQYRPHQHLKNGIMLTEGGREISWGQFYSAEAFLLNLLQKYCNKNKLVLKISACSPDQSEEECDYFRSISGNVSLEVFKREKTWSSYENIDMAEFVVFIDSALGYESLARGKKTAAFTFRGEMLGLSSLNFGWPADLEDKGPFWTNHADEHEFKRVMDYITTVSDEEWELARRRHVSQLMEYDPGNTRFLKLMKEIGVPLKSEYCGGE